MIRVGINGYGTIGRRVADAVLLQKDMTLVGVTKVRPDYRARNAVDKGIDVYLPDSKYGADFEKAGVEHKGTLADLLGKVDVIVDSTPELGERYKPVYRAAGVKVVFEGGEEHELAGLSFVAQCNYDDAVGKELVRVVSCNTTGLCRALHSLLPFGPRKVRAVLARRAADPDETGKGPIDAAVPDPIGIPSHHGPDVQSVLRELDITTMAFKVPTTHMHLHSVIATLERKVTAADVVQALEREPRVMLVDGGSGFKSTSSIIDWAREKGRPRGDVFEAAVWRDSVSVVGGEVYMFLAVHQEAIVTPENVDALRAIMATHSMDESMRLTDASLGVSRP